MTEPAEIPVDLLNPGQVFACLGFLEAAAILLGEAEGGFDWREGPARFLLRAKAEANPFEAVLSFLADARAERFAPLGYREPAEKKDGEDSSEEESADHEEVGLAAPRLSETFPANKGDRMALPIHLRDGNRPLIEIGHWADGSSRNNYKLYAGNRSAERIARAMLRGVRKKPTKKQVEARLPGSIKTRGVAQLWEESRDALLQSPFELLTPIGGSFNFDPRGAWTTIDAGYSPNRHKQQVAASPVVEILAAWGLENARPSENGLRRVRYAVWAEMLPPLLARVALNGAIPCLTTRRFGFELDFSGKNKIVTFATEERLG